MDRPTKVTVFVDTDYVVAKTSAKNGVVCTPISIWGPLHYFLSLASDLDIPAAEVLAYHLEILKDTDEYKNFVIGLAKETKKAKNATNINSLTGCADADQNSEYQRNPALFFEFQQFLLYQEIADKYHNSGSPRSAILWYEKCSECCKSDGHLLQCYRNIAVLQRHCSFFLSAEGNFKKSLELVMRNPELQSFQTPTRQDLNLLRREMENWRGTSGNLTPRMDG